MSLSRSLVEYISYFFCKSSNSDNNKHAPRPGWPTRQPTGSRMEDPNTPAGPTYDPLEPPPLWPPLPKQKGRRTKPKRLGIGAMCSVNFRNLGPKRFWQKLYPNVEN